MTPMDMRHYGVNDMSTRSAIAPEAFATNASHLAFRNLRQHLQTRIIGQDHLVDSLLIALLADGHLMVEGAPGLAKTTAIKELSAVLQGDFRRLQFTPDLLPGDLTGTDVYRPATGEFTFQPGPLFHNLVLADEINRAPAKVQSALLEAMGEHQVTVGGNTYALPQPFMVMATQNPIEHEGTYPLPEAQLDRFLLYVRIDHPDVVAERTILRLARAQATKAFGAPAAPPLQLSTEQVLSARREVLAMHMASTVEEYIVQLVMATRDPARYDKSMAGRISFGASPRATIALDRCARAHAWLLGKDYVAPEDVHAVAHDVLRHRLLLSFEAEADGVTTDSLIDELLRLVPVV
jgi:MoxR-like ATPase